MPLYEYRCSKCGETIEVIQKLSDPPLQNCTKCGGNVTKLLSGPAIQFKGAGWYITDYARKGNGSADSTEGKPKESKEPAKDAGSRDSGESPKKDSGTPKEKNSSTVSAG